jgi:hypothetical protein
MKYWLAAGLYSDVPDSGMYWISDSYCHLSLIYFCSMFDLI